MVEPRNGTIPFRFTPRQLVVSIAGPVIVLGLLAALFGGGGLGYMLGGAVVGALVVGMFRLRAGLDLTDGHAVVRGLVSTTAVPWVDITNVEIFQRGSRKLVVLEAQGRSYRPLAPVSSPLLPDADFESKSHTITQFWRDRHRPV